MEHETNCATSTDGEFCNNSGTVRVDSLEISDQGDETQTRSLDASPGPNSGVDNADKELNLPLQGDQPKTRDNIDDLGTEDLNSRVQLETASEHLGKQVETMQDHDEKSNESRPPGQTVTEGDGDREQDTTQNCHESFENSETAIRDSESSENKDLAPADLSGDEYETSETPLTVSAAMPHESANQIEAAVVPSSSSASRTGNEADELPEAIRNHEEDTPSLYHIKWIKWKGINTPIVTQNENGPCPLLAIVNVLLLQRRINISSLQEIVTAGQLMEYIGDCILEEAPKRLSEGAQLNYEQNMHDAIAIMNKLQTGLDVNVKFTGVSDFEFTPECIVFDLLSIGLFHGWLIDPQNTHTVSAVGPLSYNQLVEKIIASKQDGAESQLQSEGLIGEAFLEQTASQLTYHGLCELNSQLQSDQLCVFFRNNHFSTLYKHKEELFLLVTDQGFLTEDRVIWESLSNVEGDSYFVNAEFRTLPAATTNTPLNPGISQEDQDYLVALTLQEEQEHSARVAQGSGYPAGPVKPQPPLGQATPSVQQIQSNQEFTDLQFAMQLQEEEQRQQLRPEQQQQQQQQQRIPLRPQQGRIPASGAGSPLQSQSRSTAHQRVESNEKCTIL